MIHHTIEGNSQSHTGNLLSHTDAHVQVNKKNTHLNVNVKDFPIYFALQCSIYT